MAATTSKISQPSSITPLRIARDDLDKLGQEYYVNFYGLFEPPFQVTGTDPRFVYLSEPYKKVISLCLQVVRDRMGLAMVLGAVGTGKSSICSIIRSRLAARTDYRVAYLDDLSATPSQLMINILHEFGQEPSSRQVEALKRQFKGLLIEETQKAGNSLVILVDEAQTATKYNLELLRQLLNFETGNEKLVQIILFGQEELARKVAARPNFLSRVVSQVRLENLNREETIKLIKYRLNVAGAEYDMFTQEALEALADYGRGIPREVCKLGYHALALGSSRIERYISATTIAEAAQLAQGHSLIAPKKSPKRNEA
ncbi:MAG TPA: AAA family ATPase [Chloroflexia bacterium]|nr:AAA family ATPase [Chloroflexia bacterium]